MRKLIWYVVFSVVGFVGMQSSGGCAAQALCSGACTDYNALKCGVVCDCAACAQAPPACDSYYNCIQTFSGNCVELLLECPIPSQCQAFISANCK